MAKQFLPGLRIYRKVGEQLYFHPRGASDEKTVITLTEADSDGVLIRIDDSGGGSETSRVQPGERMVFGTQNHELMLEVMESMGGHAGFRALAGPDVIVQRVVSDDRRTK